MCPRQIQCARRPGYESIMAAGCGSWTITKSYASASSSARVLPVVVVEDGDVRSVSPAGSPWSALWIAFVTRKNSSAPRITRHSTSSPASAINGTSV